MKCSKNLFIAAGLILLATNNSVIFSMDSSVASDKPAAHALVTGFKQDGDVFTFTKPGLNAAANSGNKLARTLEELCRFANNRDVGVHGVQSNLYDFLDPQKQITLNIPVKELQKHNPSERTLDPARAPSREESVNAMVIIGLGSDNSDQLERALFDGDKEKFYTAHKGEMYIAAQRAKAEKEKGNKSKRLIAELNGTPAQMAQLRAQMAALAARENQLKELLK